MSGVDATAMGFLRGAARREAPVLSVTRTFSGAGAAGVAAAAASKGSPAGGAGGAAESSPTPGGRPGADAAAAAAGSGRSVDLAGFSDFRDNSASRPRMSAVEAAAISPAE